LRGIQEIRVADSYWRELGLQEDKEFMEVYEPFIVVPWATRSSLSSDLIRGPGGDEKRRPGGDE